MKVATFIVGVIAVGPLKDETWLVLGAAVIGPLSAIAATYIASRKGRSEGWWIVLGLLLGPIALLIVLILPASNRATGLEARSADERESPAPEATTALVVAQPSGLVGTAPPVRGLTRWTIVGGPREYSPEASDCALGWAYEIESQGARRTIRVELSETAADSTSLAEQSMTAIRSRGRSAIEPFLIRDVPPERVLIGVRGVYAG